MTFAIVANLPLGTYRGSGQDGRPERLPSVARLHSALLSAAGFGPRAEARADGALGPCEADEMALRWLEQNPPDGVQIPALEFSAGRVVAYRDDGTLRKSKSVLATKKLQKAPDAGTAVAGPFVWLWQEPPPAPVRAALQALCPDVPYLGTTESPVRLTAVDDDLDGTHVRDSGADMFTPGTVPVDAPLPGRLAELVAGHARTTGQPPSVARDRYATDEKSLSETPPREAVGPLRYRALADHTEDVPWSQVVLLPMAEHVAVENRVAWAVATHRALVRLIGDGAPALVTGVYPPATRRPANRVSLQILDRGLPVADGAASSPATLAVLVPRDADPGDVSVLFGALAGLMSVRGPGGHTIRIEPGASQVLPGSGFWRPPAKDQIRLWHTEPVAVPDTRGARGQDWTFAHAALLSLGFAWKDLLPAALGRGEQYYRGMIAAVSDRGAVVLRVSAVRTTKVTRYVHRVNEHAVVRPYRAVLLLGDLTGSRTLQAIGQSRHLGGGLLVPLDVAEGTPADAVQPPAGGGR